MKDLNNIQKGKTLFIVSMIFWLIYNTYFGWNDKPINDLEKGFDTGFHCALAVAIFHYFRPLFSFYERKIAKYANKEKKLKADSDIIT